MPDAFIHSMSFGSPIALGSYYSSTTAVETVFEAHASIKQRRRDMSLLPSNSKPSDLSPLLLWTAG